MCAGSISTRPDVRAYPESVQELIAQVDSTPLLAPEPVPQTNVFRLINANFAVSVANNVISVGKADDWWGPTQTGSMALSNNTEPIYALRINRVVPLRIPLFSDLFGPVRYEGLFGSLKGPSLSQRPVDPSPKIQLQADQEPGIRFFPGGRLRRKGPCASHFRFVLAQLHELQQCEPGGEGEPK